MRRVLIALAILSEGSSQLVANTEALWMWLQAAGLGIGAHAAMMVTGAIKVLAVVGAVFAVTLKEKH